MRNYGYALKGKEVVYTAGHTAHNLTCVAAMSRDRVEYLQFFYEGGTTLEYFAAYLQDLISVLTTRYPEKKILFVLDNLASHKTSEVHKVMQEVHVEMLFLPAYSPEFSAIESLFGRVKVELRDLKYTTKEQLAHAISTISFGMSKSRLEGFYRRTLNDMKEFYDAGDWQSCLNASE